MLHEDERIDQLYAEDIKIIQSSKVFSFSLDAVLLAHFSRVPKKGKIVDLCAGNGAVGLFLSKRTQHLKGSNLFTQNLEKRQIFC